MGAFLLTGVQIARGPDGPGGWKTDSNSCHVDPRFAHPCPTRPVPATCRATILTHTRRGRPLNPPLLVTHGLLAAGLVVASVFAMRARQAERMRRATAVLLALVVAQTVAGAVLYPTYLRDVKPALVALHAGSRPVADAFEVKEHFAFFALVLTLGAFLAARRVGSGEVGPILRVLVGGAHAATMIVAILGLVVASVRLP